ncbi:MAG: amidase domain-containing protein [Bacilli bacterium]
MKKHKKIFKIFIFILVASLVIFYFIIRKDKPVDSHTPGIIDPGTSDTRPEDKPNKKDSYLNEIKYDVALDEEIIDAIVKYMDTYYQIMYQLKEEDMTSLFSNNNQALINQTAISLLINVRSLKPNDLALSDAKYDLNIKKVTKEADIIKVVLTEDSYIKFKFMDEVSKIYNIENEFSFKKINGEYKIVAYDKVQDFFVMITDVYEDNGQEELNNIKNNYLKLVKKQVADEKKAYNEYLDNKGLTKKECDHIYNRTNALTYALKWVNKRNSNWKEYESNCQNYASQVVYNGGIPNDYSGDANASLQWKNYDDSLNNIEEAKGFTETWTYVPYFYNYVKNNTGYGMCGKVDVNRYYGEAGDIVHVGLDGPNRHALVVIGNIKKNNKVVDIIVNSNTVDLENYPLSAYVYPYQSLIKIYGWND